MNASIFYVGGSKGGVGKSKLAFALIDYLLDEEKQVVLLETDTSNPDVFKAHQPHENDRLICKEADLDSADGWIELVNAADEFPNHYLVINSAARSNIGLAKYGATLRETLAELDRNLLTFWIINRQRDSIELLRGFLNVFPDALVHVCRNLYFGEPEKFERYNSSKSRELIDSGFSRFGRSGSRQVLFRQNVHQKSTHRVTYWRSGGVTTLENCLCGNVP